MIRKATVISLRFNPGFLQTLIGYVKILEEIGISAELLVNPHYAEFEELAAVAPVIPFRRERPLKGWDIAIFVNPSLDNHRVAVELKANGSKIFYLYHEPWQLSLSYIRHEGLGVTAKAAMAHRATVPVLKLANQVLLPSKSALDAYRRTDARHNPNAVYFPLIFDDQVGESLDDLVGQKRYFSFIGNPCRSHGFDHFITAMRYGIQARLQTQFLIASRFPVPREILRDPILRRNSHRIEVRCGRPLSEDEINCCYAESFCVWNLYRRTTQSGVLPKAFMFGTPVVASRIGSFPEFVEDGINGRFADVRDMKSVWSAAQDMQDNLPRFAFGCRATFRDVFYYRSSVESLRRILG